MDCRNKKGELTVRRMPGAVPYTTRHVLVQIHDLMVDVEERPGTPRGGLVERAKSE